jgi:GGDEF domain-containing protein
MLVEEKNILRYTLFLYAILLIVPVGFVYLIVGFEQLVDAPKIIRKIDSIGFEVMKMEHIDKDRGLETRKIALEKIKKTARLLKKNGFASNNPMEKSVVNDLNQLQSCLELLPRKNPSRQNVLQCIDLIKQMTFTIEKIDYIDRKKYKSYLYLSLIATLTILILSIFAIRIFIDYRIRKESLKCPESGLFSREYCISRAKQLSAQSRRHGIEYVVMKILIPDTLILEKKNKRRFLMKMLGEVLERTLRQSDIACRYDKKNIICLLPYTKKSDFTSVKRRVTSALSRMMESRSITGEFEVIICEYAEDGIEELLKKCSA